MKVEWTEQNRTWKGDEYSGGWVSRGPDETISGEVVGFVHDGRQAIAIVRSKESLVEKFLDDLRVIDS